VLPQEEVVFEAAQTHHSLNLAQFFVVGPEKWLELLVGVGKRVPLADGY